MKNLFSKRFGELIDEADAILAKKSKWHDPFVGEVKEQVDEYAFLHWKTKARHLISASCGETSQHFKLFDDQQTGFYGTNVDTLRRMTAVVKAAQNDFDGGYLNKIHSLVQAELFDSQLEQSSELLKNEFTLAAAVVAGVVLETAISELCARNQIPNGKLDKMNADLAKAGVYNGIVQKRVTHLAAVRNAAAHGNDAEFKSYDVNAMIAEIEQSADVCDEKNALHLSSKCDYPRFGPTQLLCLASGEPIALHMEGQFVQSESLWIDGSFGNLPFPAAAR